MALPSPCNGLCSFERRTGFCIGCARTRDEIVGWRDATDAFRHRVSSRLAARRSRVGFVHRLPWAIAEIRDFALATFAGTGTWVTGVNGAIGGFRRSGDEIVAVDVADTTIAASTAQAAIYFKLSAGLRAYTVSLSPDAVSSERASSAALSHLVVIAIARKCGLADDGTGLTCLGADTDAILGGGRAETLYDFGLGDGAGSFGVRTGDEVLARSLDRYLGDRWPVFFPVLQEEIICSAPTRVVRSPLGRIEVATPLWSGAPASGPYAHFQPPRLRREIADVAGEVQDSYLPCAAYYPA